MSSAATVMRRRGFLGLLTATAWCGLRPTAWAGETDDIPDMQALPAAALHVLVDHLNGAEGPTMLPDGRVVFIARPGNVIAARADGLTETLASGLGLIVGTALGRHEENVLYICKMDPARIPRRAPGAPGNGGGQTGGPAGPAGPAGPGAPPAQPAAPPGAGAAPGAAILRLDLNSRNVTPLYTQWEGHALAGPNKLVVDRWGDLWITDVFEGALYWARTDGSVIRRVVSPLPGAHGITLSPDGKTVYVSSEERMVAFTIQGRGELAGEGGAPRSRLVAALDRNWRVDGIRTEAGGNIVMACSGRGLVVLSPQGKPLSGLALPGLAPSNLVFGGSDMRTIYATVNAIGGGGGGVPGQSVGKVVSLRWPRAGLKPA